MAISLRIINPPDGINENQLFNDQEHMDEWLDTHAHKLPGLRVENGEVYYDVNAAPAARVKQPLEEELPPAAPVKETPVIEKTPVQKLSLWQKIVIFVKKMLGLN